MVFYFYYLQVDICAEELHNSVPSKIAIQADLVPTVDLLTKALNKRNFKVDKNGPWWNKLINDGEKNKQMLQVVKRIIKLIFELFCITFFFIYLLENGPRHFGTLELLHSL